METASPNPFVAVGQNGADAMFRGGVTNGVDDDDFGPETDVDMVDDVLLSPAIAAAKALVAGCHEVDDLERQRQQLADFDDPADIDPNRDTPTPPAHEVASNANVDPLAESGGEESEEEWNYIPGKDTKTEIDFQEQEDMSSQLNPNAAEFVPVSPTRLMMMDDAIISASPGLGFEKSLDDVQVPSELEFNDEISHRPGDLGITNGPKSKHSDDYFMRDNFSTLRNKSPDFNSTSTCAQLGDDSIVSLSSSLNSSTACASSDVPFDKLEAVQNIVESKGSIFGSDGDFCNNPFGVTNVFSKSDPMTTSVIEHGDFSLSPEPEENILPGTPKSTIVEAPVSPVNEDVSPLDHQTDMDSPVKDYQPNPQKTLDFMSSDDGPEDPLVLGQERTSSSGFESENGMEEGENNFAQDTNEGFITEHRKSPPIDLSFKPIQTFSDLNPFGALQTPSTVTPVDSVETNVLLCETLSETPNKSEDNRQEDQLSFIVSTPSSFISARLKTPLDDKPVPFDELESPTDIPQFELPPNANSSVLASELPKSPEPQFNNFEETLSSKSEMLNSESETHQSKDNHTQDDYMKETNPKYEETSFTTEFDSIKGSAISSEDLDTTAGFLIEESKILNDEEDFEKLEKIVNDDKEQSKLFDENQIVSSEISQQPKSDLAHNGNTLKDIEQEYIDTFNTPEVGLVPHTEVKDTDFESETKEMNLEFESHITSQNTITDSLGHFDDGFEVINRDELTMDERSLENKHVEKGIVLDIPDQVHHLNESSSPQQNENLLLPIKSTDPFVLDGQSPSNESNTTPDDNKKTSTVHETSISFTNAFDKFSLSEGEHLETSEKPPSFTSPLEPEISKTESYQLLTPADEPICTKTESFLTEAEKPLNDDVKSEHIIEDIHAVEVEPVPTDTSHKLEENTILETVPIEIPNEISLAKEEPVLAKSEPVQSQVVTETLITALEETSEVPLTAGTPPPTPVPAPELDNKDDSEKAALVAAVAAAGAMAAGATLAVDKIKKETVVASKKLSSSTTKKLGDTTAKAPMKAAPAKAPAGKPATTKTSTTTTKPASAASKPASSTTKPAGLSAKPTTTTAPKPAATKTTAALTATKKPIASAKPATAKLTSAAPSKPAPTPPAPKAVPKHLPVNKTSTTLKSTSKPTTPTSKPTTPTAPKSPSVLKTDVVKSPPRPAVKSTLATSRLSSAAKSPLEDSDKKTMTNGVIKKLADGPLKKPATTTTAKPLAATRPSAPLSKTVPATKAPTTAASKPLANKTASSVPPKPKSTTTAATKSTVPPPIKRPTSGTAIKSADKTGKETANKQISNAKPAVNGKVPTKTVNGAKKTDAKINGKTTDKLVPSKKLDEIKAENEISTKVQEDNITTTNGFGEHNDHIIEENGSMKNEVLSPVILENVN